MKPQPVIFTDLDGTLLDYHTYSCAAALPALELIKQKNIPLIICSSKTRVEIERWRGKLNNPHPFVSENGGGIFIPNTYFSDRDLNALGKRIQRTDAYTVLVLGIPYASLRHALEKFRKDGFKVRGFGDMHAAAVAQITGLSIEEAALARRRDFDEPFISSEGGTRLPALLSAVKEEGLYCIAGGRLFHLTGDNDKGRAIAILMELYRKKFGEIITVALGDSPNDFPMLEHVDRPILVKNHRGEYDTRIALPNLIKADGIGPEGWNKAVLSVIKDMV